MLYHWLKEQQCVTKSEWTIQHSCHKERYYSVEHKSNIIESWCKITKHIRLPNEADNKNQERTKDNGTGTSVPPGPCP